MKKLTLFFTLLMASSIIFVPSCISAVCCQKKCASQCDTSCKDKNSKCKPCHSHHRKHHSNQSDDCACCQNNDAHKSGNHK